MRAEITRKEKDALLQLSTTRRSLSMTGAGWQGVMSLNQALREHDYLRRSTNSAVTAMKKRPTWIETRYLRQDRILPQGVLVMSPRANLEQG